jgi:hypothetical protein
MQGGKYYDYSGNENICTKIKKKLYRQLWFVSVSICVFVLSAYAIAEEKRIVNKSSSLHSALEFVINGIGGRRGIEIAQNLYDIGSRYTLDHR